MDASRGVLSGTMDKFKMVRRLEIQYILKEHFLVVFLLFPFLFVIFYFLSFFVGVKEKRWVGVEWRLLLNLFFQRLIPLKFRHPTYMVNSTAINFFNEKLKKIVTVEVVIVKGRED